MKGAAQPLTGEIAAFASRTELEELPAAVLLRAKLQFLSVVAGICAGQRSAGGRQISAWLARHGAPGTSPVIGWGERRDVRDAVFAHAAWSMAYDYDDYLVFGHTGHSAVTVPLAVAAARGLSMREALAAQVVANEVAGRMGFASAMGPLNGQAWTFIHNAGAAVAGAKAMGLDEAGIARALSLALYQPNTALWPGFMGSPAKLLSAAVPARAGLEAAQLAEVGLGGHPGIIEAHGGFLDLFATPRGITPGKGAPVAAMRQVFTGWSKAWVTETLAIKFTPGCAYLTAAADACAETVAQFVAAQGHPPQAADIAEITCDVTALSAAMMSLSAPFRPESGFDEVFVNFSIPESLAVLLLMGEISPRTLDGEVLAARAPELAPLAAKVRVRHDLAMTVALAREFRKGLRLTTLVRQMPWPKLFAARLQDAPMNRGVVTPGWQAVARELPGVLAGLAVSLGADRARAGDGAWDFAACDLAALRMPFAARVTLRTTGGETYTAAQGIPRGAPGRDIIETAALTRDKFQREVAPVLGTARTEGFLRDFYPNLEHRMAADVVAALAG